MSQPPLTVPLSPDPTDAPAPPVERSFVSHARLISALTFLSRIFGLIREGVVAKYFGAGMVSDAFSVAFKVPNSFRKLLGEGALSAAFIPIYAQTLKTGNSTDANRFAAASVNLLTLILIALTVVGEALLLCVIVWWPLQPENLLMVKLTAIMLPYVLLICLTAFLGGILQVHRRFGLPAFAPVLLNVIHIAVVVIGARILMLAGKTGPAQEAAQIKLVYWLAGFVLVAGVMQVQLLLPSLKAVGFRFILAVKLFTPEVKKMLRLSAPMALATGVLQLSVLIDTGITVMLTQRRQSHAFHLLGHWIAYPMAMGAVARLNWAQYLYQFPLGVFAVALATAIFPSLSASALDNDRGKFKASLRHGIIIALWEGFAASAGLIIVRYPAIRLLFQRGQFTSQDTQWVALSVLFYSAAIWAFSLQQILNRAYYALHDTMTPLILSIITLGVNTIVEIPLAFTKLGESGMAAGTLVSFVIQAIVMLILLDRKIGGIGFARILASAAKMLLACAIMILACWAIQKWPGYPRGSRFLPSLAQLILLMVVGAIAYLATCYLTRLKTR